MTFVWALLWLVLAVGIFGILGWSINVAMAQKKAWREFGTKYKLDIKPGFGGTPWMRPVSLSGAINGRRLNIYPQVEQNERERLQRIYTHIEVCLNNPTLADMVLSKEFLPASLSSLGLPAAFSINMPEWPKLKVAQTDNAIAATAWFTPARVKAMASFMALAAKDVEPIFVADTAQSFLLWRGEDPFKDPRKLNALVQKLFALAKELDADDAGINAKPKASSDNVPPDTAA